MKTAFRSLLLGIALVASLGAVASAKAPAAKPHRIEIAVTPKGFEPDRIAVTQTHDCIGFEPGRESRSRFDRTTPHSDRRGCQARTHQKNKESRRNGYSANHLPQGAKKPPQFGGKVV